MKMPLPGPGIVMSCVSCSRPSSERRSISIERLPFCRPDQNRLSPSRRQRPALPVQPAAGRVEADDVRAELRERHARRRRGDERRALDHAHAVENSLAHAIAPTSRQSRTASSAPSARCADTSMRSVTRPPPAGQRLGVLEMHRAAQHVALEDRREVVAVMPADDRHEVGQRLGEVRGGDADRVAAVDEALAGVSASPGSVCALAMFSDRRTSSGAAVTLSPPSSDPRRRRAEVGEVRAGDLRAVDVEVEPVERRVQRVGRQVGGELVEVVGVRLRGVDVVDRQHRAAPVVEDRAVLLVGRDDVQDGEAGRLAALLDRVALQRDDLGRRLQRVADRRQAAQHEAAVEEVADDALRRQRRLADRDVADEHRVREAAAGDALGQRRVEREAQAVADDRLVQRRVALR